MNISYFLRASGEPLSLKGDGYTIDIAPLTHKVSYSSAKVAFEASALDVHIVPGDDRYKMVVVSPDIFLEVDLCHSVSTALLAPGRDLTRLN
ncbi:hypothetical protein [Vibrio mediterranei]|uniref:Uncharacterized protein n=1 Tax=Vibrio mediterranei TaxID=689 RepID=A0ABX5D650_9VIBR|nr:hypothetical protein [Vibrio mediterranei]MCG9657606.1 hypothetical protein [Vibrio mediterranei]PRQ65144.1 hypothetical protein COR51_23775 [Vibrio mediterranei]